MKLTKKVNIYSGYNGSIKIEVKEYKGQGTEKSPHIATGKMWVMDPEVACQTIEKVIALNGAIETKSNRQKLTRLTPKI